MNVFTGVVSVLSIIHCVNVMTNKEKLNFPVRVGMNVYLRKNNEGIFFN